MGKRYQVHGPKDEAFEYHDVPFQTYVNVRRRVMGAASCARDGETANFDSGAWKGRVTG